VNLPHGPAHAIRPSISSIICASHNAYILDPQSKKPPHTFTASTNTVRAILNSTTRSSQSLRFLTAAETDHFIPVFDAESPTLIGTLPTENEVLSLDLYSSPDNSKLAEREEDLSVRLSRPLEALLVVNKDGALEIFPEPFDFGNVPSKKEAETPKARAQRINRKRAALVRIRKDDTKSTVVPLVNACFQGNDIALAWVEGGVDVIFDKVQWLDEAGGNMILKNETDITKAKRGAGIGGAVMNGVKDIGRSHVDESRVVIVNGGDVEDVPMADEPSEVIEISSGEESDSEEEDPPRPMQGEETGVEEDTENIDVEMKDTEAPEVVDEGSDAGEVQAEAAEEPSFGDLLRANAPEAVDVQASFTDQNAQSLVPVEEKGLQHLPSGMSLGTVLTQSLRTNDTNLLETCFHIRDLQIVRATIERLDSSFATTLLQKLAERLHSRPGRAGSLMVWIQWTLVAHGGYLAGQPEVMQKLASLHRVVKDRANSLQPLLTLKGKLDMLEAQMNLRKSMQSRSRAANALEEDDEEGVIYVEGQEEFASEEEEVNDGVENGVRPRQANPKLPTSASNGEDSSDAPSEDEESGDDMPNTANGIIADTADEGSDSEGESLLDEEASSTNVDSVDEGSGGEDVDHESVDSVHSSDADASPPPKRPAKSKLSNGIGARKR
jgi:U3 small nucleolar RNA-associated protein 5